MYKKIKLTTKNLPYKADQKLFERAKFLAFLISDNENLNLKTFRIKKHGFNSTNCCGLCYYWKFTISILIRKKNKNGEWRKKPESWSEIKDTVIHELTHLKLMNGKHNDEFLKIKKDFETKYEYFLYNRY